MLNFQPTQNTKNGLKVENSHKSENSNSGDFLLTLLKSINEQKEPNTTISKNQTQNNNQSQNYSSFNADENIVQEQENIVLEGIVIGKEGSNISMLDENLQNSASDDFIQLLSILEAVNGGEFGKFPSISNALEKLISIEENINDLKNVKNLQDLLKIAQKLELNLSKISINHDDLKALQTKFPKLNELDFFKDTTSKFNKILATNSANNISNITLADLLKTDLTSSKTNITAAIASAKILPKTEEKPQKNANLKNILNDENIKQIKSDKSILQQEIKTDPNKAFDVQTYLNTISKKAASALENSSLQEENTPNFNTNEQNKNDSIKEILNLTKMQDKIISKEVATQSLRTFSSDLMQKINEFKPPVTRINMQLHPAELGEVNVTMIARANNLQVNITSTNNTMALFLQNQAEFKANLVNMGFSEIQMSFSDNKQNGGQFEHKKTAKRTYENEDIAINEFEENASSTLEITLPRYI